MLLHNILDISKYLTRKNHMKYMLFPLTSFMFFGNGYALDTIPQDIFNTIITQSLEVIPRLITVNKPLLQRIVLYFKPLDQETVLLHLKRCIQSKDAAVTKCIITHNTCFIPNTADSQKIGIFLACEIIHKKIDTPIEGIIAAKYPYAYYDAIKVVNPHFDFKDIRDRLKKGTILQKHRASLRAPLPVIPVFHWLLEYCPLISTPESDQKIQGPIEYTSIELLLDLGANPDYLEGSRSAMTIINSLKDHNEQEMLKKIVTPYRRTPINTTDLFYPGSKGYRGASY
jgi:hypothetical protein